MGPKVLFVVFFYSVSSEKVNKLKEVEESSWKTLLLRPNTSATNSTNRELATDFLSFLHDLKQSVGVGNGHHNCRETDQKPLRCRRTELSKCLSPDELFDLVPNTTKTLGEALNGLCPVLLSQVYLGLDCHPSPIDSNPSLRPSPDAVWGIGILCITIISGCSLVGVVTLPLFNQNLFQNLLMLFEGLAVGSLLSSALFHLIPQAYNLVGQDAEHGYLWKSAIIFVGFYVFFLGEHLMKTIIETKKERRNRKEMKRKALITNNAFTAENVEKENGVVMTYVNNLVKSVDDDTSNGSINNSISQMEDTLPFHSHSHGVPLRNDKSIATVAWMIILGDAWHNFIDGLSIGAAFSESILAGVSISVAIVCEEFPHELGDFAVLINSGMSMKQAITYNFLSACTCYVGFVFGVVLGDISEASYFIFAFASGMFLYISLVDMVKELDEAIKEARNQGIAKVLKVFLLQNLGLMIAVFTLFLLARYSEKINFHE